MDILVHCSVHTTVHTNVVAMDTFVHSGVSLLGIELQYFDRCDLVLICSELNVDVFAIQLRDCTLNHSRSPSKSVCNCVIIGLDASTVWAGPSGGEMTPQVKFRPVARHFRLV